MEPKKPGEQVSQEDPVKPGAHVHVPEELQIPAPAHGGEHAEDWMSTRENEPELEDGSCLTSGIESQRIMRLLPFPVLTDTQTLDERAIEPALRGVELLEPGEDDRAENDAWPEYSEPGYAARPGPRAKFRGREREDVVLKPGDGVRLAEDAVRRS